MSKLIVASLPGGPCLAQRVAGPRQQGLDRALRHAEDPRDLVTERSS
jgi:hypothetical protein